MRPYVSAPSQLKNIPGPQRVFLVLFGLLFASGGGFLLSNGVRQFITWRAAGNWTQVPAQLSWINVEGGESLQQVDCRYTYTFAGRQYEGSRASPTPGTNGRYYLPPHVAIKLADCPRTQQPVECYVDPNNPASSVLYRDVDNLNLVGGFYVSSGIVITGLLVVLVGTYSWFTRLDLARRQRAFPGQPWKWRKQWARDELEMGNRANSVVLWIVAVFWWYIAAPLYIVGVIPMLLQGQLWVAVFFIHAVVGIALVWAAARGSFRTVRFTGSRFVLDTRPAWTGESLRGTLVLSGRLATISVVKVTLECIHIVFGGRSEKRETLWFDRKNIQPPQPVFGQTELRVPVKLDIPADCLETSNKNPHDRIEWALRFNAALAGPDLELDFEIPVFRRGPHKD